MNQQNNWAYVFLLLIIATIVAVSILYYSQETIKEINYLSERSAIIER